ncbi:MAG TPA: hypothetical protein VIR81_14185, partial [Myxococcales bacterium]
MIGALLGLSLALQAAPAAQQPSPPSGEQPSPPPAAQPGDIDLLPPEAAPDAATAARQQELDRQLHRRRQMLQLHQLGGMLTLASLGATVVFGELNYIDKYGGGG